VENIFNFAVNITEKANKIILKNLNRIREISYKKGDFNLVTNVDKEVEALLIKEIISRFPNHSIIAEESGKYIRDPNYEWFIDPIDGTTNFAHAYPCFCISVGFARKKKLEFGLIKNPSTGDLYSAIKNKGAKLNGKTIKVSKIKTLRESLLITGFPYERKKSKINNFKYFKNLTGCSHGVRRDGAAALDLCYVASGAADGFWELKLSPWDMAAGALIVEEAGGKVTNFRGGKFDIYCKEIIASNGFIHKELVKKLNT
jgi:myo-inositol-1(or 4)-monophosphatase